MIPGMAFEKGVGAIGKGIGALAKTSSPVARAMNKARAITKLDNAYNMARVQALAKDGITAIGSVLVKIFKKLVVLQNRFIKKLLIYLVICPMLNIVNG